MSFNFGKQSYIKNFVLMITLCLLVNCSSVKPSEQTVIIVKISPFYNDKVSEEENFWRFNNSLFPQEKIPDPIPKGIPNYDAILTVLLEENGKIALNSMEHGNVSNTEKLQTALEIVFKEREKDGVYEPKSQRIVKAVGIFADKSVKYKDFFAVVEAVKKSGADPIVLRFEDDAGIFKVISKN